MPDGDLLQEITSVWHLEKNVIHKISDILLYMNKNFVPKMRNYPTVEAMQTNEFKKNVVMKDDIKRKLVKLLLSEIEKERNGDMVERLYLQKSIEMLIEVGMQSRKIYEHEFESALIAQTRDYYRNESNNLIS
jgi:cullin 3